MNTPASRRGGTDVRILAGGLAVLAAFLTLVLALSTGWWLALPLVLLVIAAPVVRSALGRSLTRATEITDPKDPAVRVLQGLWHAAPGFPIPRLLITRNTAPTAFVAGWPGRPRLVLSDGLLDEDYAVYRAAIARELGKLRQPFAALDAFAWSLPVAALIVMLARIPSGAWLTFVAALGTVLAIAAVTLMVHARERAADEHAVKLTGDPAGVAGALRAADDHTPSGARWWLLGALTLVPPVGRAVRDFVSPSAADRAAALDGQVREADGFITGSLPAVAARATAEDEPAHMGTHTPGTTDDFKKPARSDRDGTALMVLLGVVSLAAVAILLALTFLGGDDGTRTAASPRASTGSGERGGDTVTVTQPRTDDRECPRNNNGNPDAPTLIDGGVQAVGTQLRWWVRWCDDQDKGNAWVFLHLAYGSEPHHRYFIRRRTISRTHPVTLRYSVVPANLGIPPRRYRWRLIVRDINAYTDSKRGVGTIFVPGIP